eukprot:4848531-Alexandrium_andersonii.AAC.1
MYRLVAGTARSAGAMYLITIQSLSGIRRVASMGCVSSSVARAQASQSQEAVQGLPPAGGANQAPHT